MGTFRIPKYSIVIVENGEERKRTTIWAELISAEGKKSWTQAHEYSMYRELEGLEGNRVTNLHYDDVCGGKWEKSVDEFDYEYRNHKLYIYVK